MKGYRRIVAGLFLFLSPVAAAQEHPDLGKLSDYPVSSEVWLGSMISDVLVNPRVPIEVSRSGDYKWKVEDGAEVREGDVVGLTGAKLIEISERRYALDQSRHARNMEDLEWSSADKERSARAKLRELEETISRMEMTPKEREILGADFAKRLVKERKEIETEIAAVRKRLENGYFEELLMLERKSAELELERTGRELEETIQASEIIAADTGKLEITSHGPVRGHTIVGYLVKDGLAEATLELVDPRLQNMAGAEMAIEVRGDDGVNYRGHYLRDLKERSLTRNARMAVFQINKPTPEAPVPGALAGSRMVRVFRILSEPSHLIPKEDLLFKFPKEITENGWARFIESRWPGVKILYISPKHVVVAKG